MPPMSFVLSEFLARARCLVKDLVRAVATILRNWWDDELWYLFDNKTRFQLTLRDARMSREHGVYPKDLMYEERYVSEDPGPWLKANIRGPYCYRVSKSGNLYFLKFSRKSDMAMLIVALCES